MNVHPNHDDTVSIPSCGMGRLSRLVEPVVLLAVKQHSGVHGYDIVQHFMTLAMTDSEIEPGAVYRSLRQLEGNGMVVSTWDANSHGPAKRLYHITERGDIHLQEWVELIENRRREMNRFLMAYEEMQAKPEQSDKAQGEVRDARDARVSDLTTNTGPGARLSGTGKPSANAI